MTAQQTLYRNARVISPLGRPVTSFATEDGRVTWLGADRDAPVDPRQRRVDLQGALVTPAFVDAHVHATSTGLALTGLDLRHAGSLAEAIRLVEAAAREARGRPLLGSGWDETDWPEGRPPTAAELDRASYGGAVYLSRVDKHSAVVSSALLAAVPQARSSSGFDASGWQRGPAHDAVREAAYAALTASQRRDAQRVALRHAASLGIACVHEMAGPVISSANDLAELILLAAAEPLPEVVPYWAELLGVDTARQLGAVGAAGDLFCDGSLGSHTAALREPYTDALQTTGRLRFPTEDVAEHVVRCVEAGLQAGFHAIGDAAVDQVLDAVELATQRLGRPAGIGSRIEHAEFVLDPARLAASGLAASMQPRFDELWGGAAGMYAQRLGADRAARLNRFAELAAAGVPLAFGSDAPVTELGPWAAVRAAVHHTDPAAGLPLAAAFHAHTAAGWRAAGRAGEGELAPGAAATFAVWRDGRAGGVDGADRADRADRADGAALPELSPDAPLPSCLATVLRGQVLYEDPAHAGLLGR